MDFHLFLISAMKRGNEQFMFPMVGSAHGILFFIIIKKKLYIPTMYQQCGLLLSGECLILLYHEKTDIFKMYSSTFTPFM